MRENMKHGLLALLYLSGAGHVAIGLLYLSLAIAESWS